MGGLLKPKREFFCNKKKIIIPNFPLFGLLLERIKEISFDGGIFLILSNK